MKIKLEVTLTKGKLRALEFEMRMNGSWQQQPELYKAVCAALGYKNNVKMVEIYTELKAITKK